MPCKTLEFANRRLQLALRCGIVGDTARGFEMAPKYVEPRLGAESFSCPHCGAYSHQTWYSTFLDRYEVGKQPDVFRYKDVGLAIARMDEDDRAKAQQFLQRLKKNEVTYDLHRFGKTLGMEMVNVSLSHCFSCRGFSIWVRDGIVYPEHNSTLEAHEEMPPPVKDIFQEAAGIVDKSPRGAAALVRLAFQELMPFLDERGKDLNADIASLVKKGLEPDIQKAMDALLVIGNNAVHPGVIDLSDDKATAVALFELLNLIVERRIAVPNRISEIYSMLPPGALEAIEKRDKKGE